MLELASVVMFRGTLLGTRNKNVRYYLLFVTVLRIRWVRFVRLENSSDTILAAELNNGSLKTLRATLFSYALLWYQT